MQYLGLFVSLVLLVGSELTPRHAQALLIVEDAPGSAHPDIQSAVDAAESGDVILVEPGVYPAFVIDGKSLTIQAREPLSVQVTNIMPFVLPDMRTVDIQGLAAHQEVVLRGLRLRGADVLAPEMVAAVFATNCQGAILVEDCFVSGSLVLSEADSLTVQRSVVDPGNTVFEQGFQVHYPRPGAMVVRSRLTLHGSSIKGTTGQETFFIDIAGLFPAGPGGAAIVADPDSEVFLFGSGAAGGNGGDSIGYFGIPAGDAGDGIRADPGSLVRLRASAVVAGTGGLASGMNANGQDGMAFVGPPEVFETLPGPSHRFTISSPQDDQQSVEIFYEGQPGDLAILAVADRWRPSIYLPTALSLLHVGNVHRTYLMDPVPSSGERTVSVSVPDLGPGVSFLRFACQMVILDANGTPHLSGPSSVLYLDSGV